MHKKIKLDTIDKDISIQCRAAIDMALVEEYAELMSEGVEFPPITVCGTPERSWIADGWHRLLAMERIGMLDAVVDMFAGDRAEALKYALSANDDHGRRRTNADKRRAVEVALREFPDLSSRAIAEMCAVSPDFVSRVRALSSDDNAPSTVTTTDGRQYPAKRSRPEPQIFPREDEEPVPDDDEGDYEYDIESLPPHERALLAPPPEPEPDPNDTVYKQHAECRDNAIAWLRQIPEDSPWYATLLSSVAEWVDSTLAARE